MHRVEGTSFTDDSKFSRCSNIFARSSNVGEYSMLDDRAARPHKKYTLARRIFSLGCCLKTLASLSRIVVSTFVLIF